MSGRLTVLLLLAVCGAISGNPIDGSIDRIVGGFELNITQVPWQVSIERESFFCGGSIIGKRWILTSATCVRYYVDSPSHLLARVGATRAEDDGILRRAKRIILHDKYNVSNYEETDYDFALFELYTDLQYTDAIQPIRVHDATDGVLENGQTFLISGWGITRNSSEADGILRGAFVAAIDREVCQQVHGRYVTIMPRILCAGNYEHGGIDACRSDYGGPLVAFSGAAKEPVLVGVIGQRPNSQNCGKPKYPGIYSKIIAVRDWIKSTAGI